MKPNKTVDQKFIDFDFHLSLKSSFALKNSFFALHFFVSLHFIQIKNCSSGCCKGCCCCALLCHCVFFILCVFFSSASFPLQSLCQSYSLFYFPAFALAAMFHSCYCVRFSYCIVYFWMFSTQFRSVYSIECRTLFTSTLAYSWQIQYWAKYLMCSFDFFFALFITQFCSLFLSIVQHFINVIVSFPSTWNAAIIIWSLCKRVRRPFSTNLLAAREILRRIVFWLCDPWLCSAFQTTNQTGPNSKVRRL